MYRLISGVYLGWGLAANDAANVFGTGVASGVIKYRTAIILTSIFVLIGAYLEGSRGIHTISALADVDVNEAFIASLAAGITINILTIFALPVSTSQAIVGAILAAGALGRAIQYWVLFKILISWVLNPVVAALISYSLYRVSGSLIEGRIKNIRIWSLFMKLGFYTVGIYGAYALGANNVANTTGVFVKAGLFTAKMAALIGGLSIALGALTYSRGVMMTVGGSITHMSDFAALIAILGESITVHIFAWIGVPVSTSQAIVGGVVGVGYVKSSRAINFRMVRRIIFGWISTPLAAFAICLIVLRIQSLFFV